MKLCPFLFTAPKPQNPMQQGPECKGGDCAAYDGIFNQCGIGSLGLVADRLDSIKGVLEDIRVDVSD